MTYGQIHGAHPAANFTEKMPASQIMTQGMMTSPADQQKAPLPALALILQEIHERITYLDNQLGRVAQTFGRLAAANPHTGAMGRDLAPANTPASLTEDLIQVRERLGNLAGAAANLAGAFEELV